jgi:hypothetical protein
MYFTIQFLEVNTIKHGFYQHYCYYYREAQTTKVMMSIGIFLTYPLVMYPAVEILLPSIFKWTKASEKMEVVYELAFRYFLVAITCKLLITI